MPIGENVLSIPVITSSVKAVRGIRTDCGVIGSLKVVFRRMLQNATNLGAVWVAEPLIKRFQRILLQYATVSHIATVFLL